MTLSRRVWIVCATALLVVVINSHSAHGRQGLYLGGGFVDQSANGNLDGHQVLRDPSGNEYLVGSVDDSSTQFGTFEFGYGFNENVALEFLTTHSDNTAHHVIGGKTTASLSTTLVGLRLGAPLGRFAEWFVRVGRASSELMYTNYVLRQPNFVTKGDANFSGEGIGTGFGFEVYGEHWGMEAGITNYPISYDKGSMSSGGSTFDLPHRLDTVIITSYLSFIYHFDFDPMGIFRR
jgi:hypothetical protein